MYKYSNDKTIAQFFVTDTSKKVTIYQTSWSFYKVEVDGVEYTDSDLQTLANGFTFSSPGIHTVKYQERQYDGSYDISGFLNQCDELISVTLSQNVHSITSSFQNCPKLSKVIGKNLLRIDTANFTNCPCLISMGIIGSGSSIEYNKDKLAVISSFPMSLKNLYISPKINSINTNSQALTNKLESIVVDSANKMYNSNNNCNAVINTANNTLVLGCKNTVIPNGVTSIGKYAFNGNEIITEIIIPDSVTHISDYAFNNCVNLANVTFGNNIISIGQYAFYCTSLTSAVLPNSVTYIGNSAFYGCKCLTNVTIPSCYLNYNVFSNCNIINLTMSLDCYISSNVFTLTSIDNLTLIGTEIKDNAFQGSSVKSVVIPNTVTSIGQVLQASLLIVAIQNLIHVTIVTQSLTPQIIR